MTQSTDEERGESLLDKTVGFIGTGNMAEALIKGMLAAGIVTADKIAGSDPRRERVEQLKKTFPGIHATTHNEDVMRRAEVLVLSVKPQILVPVCDEVAPWLKPRATVISIAAGVPLSVIEAHLPKGTH